MLTEEQARQKWCPFARVTDNGCATNRHAGTKKGKDGKPRILRGNALCIASDCMAWRFRLQPTKYRKIANDLYVPAEWENAGYCGLAGKPDA